MMSRTGDPFKSGWGNINRHTSNQQQPDSYKQAHNTQWDITPSIHPLLLMRDLIYICTVLIEIPGKFYITLTGAALQWKPMLPSSWCSWNPFYLTNHPPVVLHTLHMHTTQNPNLLRFFFLTHCKYLLWLGLGLVRSHHQIVIRVGWFAKVRRFLRTPAHSFYSDVNGLTLQIKSQQRALNLTTSLCIFMLSCTL